MAKRQRLAGQRGANGLKAHVVAGVAAAVAAGMMWLIPACSISSHGPGQAEAPGFGLVYEPPALFPAYYLPPTVPDHFVDATQMVDVDALYQPGETVAMNSIVVAAATGRVRELGGQLSEAEMRAVLEQASAPSAWLDDLLTIAWCESKYSPYAAGDSGNSLGVFQLWRGWFRDGEDPFDPLANARVAVRVREIRGRFGGGGGWSCADLNGIR